jgi:hypothetical protein
VGKVPKKANGQRDWSSLPDGCYLIEWREKGKRRRLPAGATVAQALEVQRRKHAELEAVAFGIIVPRPRAEDVPKPVLLDELIDRYLDQIETLKKPNTFRKYNAVLKRFAKHFAGLPLEAVSVEDLNVRTPILHSRVVHLFSISTEAHSRKHVEADAAVRGAHATQPFVRSRMGNSEIRI